jgi:hypothetical protein
MSEHSLSEYADKIFQKDRISFGDVQRLQRSVLPNGVASREEAELLIELDRRVEKSDDTWRRCLVAMIVDFVVWSERPTGVVEEDTARWLSAALDGSASSTARLIVREIAEEAQAFENDALLALADVTRTSRLACKSKAAPVLTAGA